MIASSCLYCKEFNAAFLSSVIIGMKNCGRITYILGNLCDISTIPELYNSFSGSKSDTKTAYSQFFSRHHLLHSFYFALLHSMLF